MSLFLKKMLNRWQRWRTVCRYCGKRSHCHQGRRVHNGGISWCFVRDLKTLRRVEEAEEAMENEQKALEILNSYKIT